MKTSILLISLTVLLSCSNDKKCELPPQTIGKGQIIPNALVQQPLITWIMRDQEHVIKSDSQNVYKLLVSFDNGASFDSIDFNHYTLLGKFAREGCHVLFDRSVIKKESESKYYYEIKVLHCGNCKTNWESMNWVLIPKIPDDYSVGFKVEYLDLDKN